MKSTPSNAGKGRFLRWMSRLLLESATVLETRTLGAHFVWLRIQASEAAAERWQPGDKIQILLPDDEVRTYTPIGWEASGATELLVFCQQDSPASRWARGIDVGDTLSFVGPQRSLRLPQGESTMLGDETSIAVGAAYTRARVDRVRMAIELGPEVDAEPVLEHLDLTETTLIRRTPSGSHYGALAREALSSKTIAITGGAPLVRSTRDELVRQGVKPTKIKTYWIPGRAGLD